MKSLRTKTIIGLIGMLVVIAAVVVIVITTGNKTNPKNKKQDINENEISTTPDDKASNETKANLSNKGIIVDIDKNNSSIIIKDIDSDSETTYSFNSTTNAFDKYDKSVTPLHYKIGDIVEYDANLQSFVLETIKTCKDAWEYQFVKNLFYDETIGKITIGEKIYRFDDNLVVINAKSFSKISDIEKQDVLHVRGIDNKICVIIVAKGHGYLALDDTTNFEGGIIDIGRSKSEIITKDFSILLPEGEYNVRISNGTYEGSKTMKINRNETSLFPAIEFGPKPVAMGRMTFNINPKGATLFVDNAEVKKHKKVELTYGSHDVEVALGGYMTYKGKVNVTKTDDSIDIFLVDNNILTDEDEDYWPDDSWSDDNDLGDDDDDDWWSDDDSDWDDSDDDDSDLDDDDDSDWDDDDDSDWNDDDSDLDDDDTDWYDDSEDDNTDRNNLDDKNDDNSNDKHLADNQDDDDLDDSENQVKNNNRMIISCTEGAKVYINDEYMGTINNGKLDIEKKTGNIVLRFEKTGYQTKTYTIFIEEGKQDATFSFPDMAAE